MYKTYVIARYTFWEAIKSKILMNVLFVGLFLLLASYVASALTYGSVAKISIDVGLGLISIAVKVIAIFYGVNILQNEIENRTIYLILSRPVSKIEYFLGRVFGMGLMLLINVTLLGLFTLIIFKYNGGSLSSLIIWSLFFNFLEAFLLLLIVVVCSLFCSKVLSIIIGIVSYLAGYTCESLLNSNQLADSGPFHFILKIVSFILPNFSRLNLKDYILYEQSLSGSILGASLLHGLIYIMGMIILGCIIMNNKSLD